MKLCIFLCNCYPDQDRHHFWYLRGPCILSVSIPSPQGHHEFCPFLTTCKCHQVVCTLWVMLFHTALCLWAPSHLVCFGNLSFPLLWGIPFLMCYNLLMHSTLDGCLCCFPFGVIVNKVLWIFTYMSSGGCKHLFLLSIYPGVIWGIL